MTGFDAGFFAGGRLRFISGRQCRARRAQVKFHRRQRVTHRAVAAGAGCHVLAGERVRGDGGLRQAVRDLPRPFANAANFRGFPHMPGNDFVLRYAGERRSEGQDVMRVQTDHRRGARGWIGTPYRHQASLKGVGCDCLGLVRGVWREVMGEEPEAPPAYRPAGPRRAARGAWRRPRAGT